MLGYFANEVAIRSSLAGRPTYSELLERIRAKLLAAWAAQDVPFHEVVAALGAPRVAGTTPVFQAMFALQEVSWHVLDVDTTPAQGLHADIVRLETNRSKFAVHLMLRERADGGLDGDLLYPTDRWDGATMQRMARHYETLAASAVDMPDTCPVGALQMLPPDEQHLVVVEWNKTSPSPKFPPPQRIEVQVAAAAAKYPESIAVEEAGGRKLTYGDLMQQSAAVAAHLGCSQGGVVALAFGRELEMVVGALAVLRSGAAYLAIDVENTPLARIRAMLEDSKPHTFLMIDR